MVTRLPYSPVHSVAWLENFFKKDYYKKPYDRFMWWRSYTPKRKPLTNRHPLKDRILNGDFDIAPYRLESELVEHRLNSRYQDCTSRFGEVDHGRYNSEASVDKARRKRLLEDYDKEETRRLEELKKAFVLNIKMTKEQYDREVVNYTGPDLINFYYRMVDKYGTYWKPLSYRSKT